jgi:hypothetical protein
MINQAGAFTVQEMVTAAPDWPNRFVEFLNQKQKWAIAPTSRRIMNPTAEAPGASTGKHV